MDTHKYDKELVRSQTVLYSGLHRAWNILEFVLFLCLCEQCVYVVVAVEPTHTNVRAET